MQYISKLQSGQRIIENYLCRDKQTLLTKAGKSYLKLSLQDKTGTINGMVWEVNAQIGEFEKNDYIKVDGLVNSFQGELQLSITRLRRAEPGEYDPGDYCKTTEKDPVALYAGITEQIRAMHNPYLKQLLSIFFLEDETLWRQFSEHPAAKNIHHNYVGGLLEHSESVMRLALGMIDVYPTADRELVIAGALLHDIGKLTEIEGAPFCNYTDAGQLIGHIPLGYLTVHEKIKQIPGFPQDLALQLEHIILSHHGELEYGSPKVPVTLEAMILHLADYSDAKLKQVTEAIAEDREEGNWTAYHRILGRNLYKPEKKDE